MQIGSAPGQRKHFNQLDSLRGLAALAVVFLHWHMLWVQTPHPRMLELAIQLSPLKLAINGHSSVVMFFVLSGFVLSLPQIGGIAFSYPAYLIKRICRIYIPYLFALAVAIACCWHWHGLQAYDVWFRQTWPTAPDWNLIWHHLLFLGDYKSDAYNTAFWTLIQEMRISLIFPIVCAAVLRFRAPGGLAIAAGFCALGALCDRFNLLPRTYCSTLAYISMFIFGILLARYRQHLGDQLARCGKAIYWSIFTVCLLIYAYAPSVFLRLHDTSASWDVVTAAGASGIILFALVDPMLERLLLRRTFVFLGRISYSVYLIHGTLLFAAAYIFYGKVQPGVWLVPFVALTLLLATAMYRFVEAPAISLGKALTAWNRPPAKQPRLVASA